MKLLLAIAMLLVLSACTTVQECAKSCEKTGMLLHQGEMCLCNPTPSR